MINRGGGLIQNHNRAASKDSTRESDQLALALTEILTTSFNMGIKSPPVPAAKALQDIRALSVGEFLRRIEVETDAAGEENGILGDERDSSAECLCADVGDVDAVDHNVACFWADDTKK